MEGSAKKTRICQICGDVAKSMHFGGLCCDSCKAFFRRSVQSDGFRHFKCSGDNHCVISIASRKFCKLCRFNKCEKVGMVREWVMSEEERIQLMKSRLTKKADGHEPEAGVDPTLVNSYKGRVALTASGAPNLHGLNRRRHMECRRRGTEDPDGVPPTPSSDGEGTREPGEVDISVYKKRNLEPGEVDPSMFRSNKVLEPGQVDHTLYRKPRKKCGKDVSVDEGADKYHRNEDSCVEILPSDKSDVEPLEPEGVCIVKEKKTRRTRGISLYSLDKKKKDFPSHNVDKGGTQPLTESSDDLVKSAAKPSVLLHGANLESPIASIDYSIGSDCGESDTTMSYPSSDPMTTRSSPSSDRGSASSPDTRDGLDRFRPYGNSNLSLHSNLDYRPESLAKRRHNSDPSTDERLRMSSFVLEQSSFGKQDLTYKPDTSLGSAGNSLPNSPLSTEGDSKTEFINASLNENTEILYCHEDNSYDLSLNNFPRDPDKYAIMINERPGLPITNYMDNHELYKLKTVVRNMQKMEHHLPYSGDMSSSVMGSYAQFIKRVTFFLDQFEEFSCWPVHEQSSAIKNNMTVIALVFGSSFLDNRSGNYKNFLPSPTKKVTDMPAIEATLTPNIFRKFQEVIGILGQFQVDIRMGYMIILIIVLNEDDALFYKKLLYKYICWKYGQTNAAHLNSHLFKAISGIRQHSCIFENMTAKTDRDDSYDEEGFSKRIKKEVPEDDLQSSLSLLSDTIPYQMGDMQSSNGAGPNFDVLRKMFYSGASREELREYFWSGSSPKANVKVEESSSPSDLSFTGVPQSQGMNINQSNLNSEISGSNYHKAGFEPDVSMLQDMQGDTGNLKSDTSQLDFCGNLLPQDLSGYNDHQGMDLNLLSETVPGNMSPNIPSELLSDHCANKSVQNSGPNGSFGNAFSGESPQTVPTNFGSSADAGVQAMIAKHGADKLKEMYLSGDMKNLKSMFSQASAATRPELSASLSQFGNSNPRFSSFATAGLDLRAKFGGSNFGSAANSSPFSTSGHGPAFEFSAPSSTIERPERFSHEGSNALSSPPYSLSSRNLRRDDISHSMPSEQYTKRSLLPQNSDSSFSPSPTLDTQSSFAHIPPRFSSPVPAHAMQQPNVKELPAPMSTLQLSSPSYASAFNFSASSFRESLSSNSAFGQGPSGGSSMNQPFPSPSHNPSPDIPTGGRHCASGWPVGEPRADPPHQPFTPTPPNSASGSAQFSVQRLKDMERSTFNPSNYFD